MEKTLICSHRHGVAELTLNRPEARNALNPSLRRALSDGLNEADSDQAIGCIVLTGAGTAFCAGVDLKSLSDTESAQFRSDPATDIACCSTPVIAAINGACIGGGLEMVLACDFIIAAHEAVFADGHAALGFIATWELYDRLPRAVGVRQATELCLTGRRFDGREAVGLGLATRAVPLTELRRIAMETAQQIAALGPLLRSEICERLRRDGGAS
jgi:enoyl-CoA hydratase